jgi:hypothetical protein
MTSLVMRLCAEVVSPEQADKAVGKAQRALARASQSGSPKGLALALGRLQRAQMLREMVRTRSGRPAPSLAPYTRPPKAALEAAGEDYHARVLENGISQENAHVREAPRCAQHPSQPASTCVWCGIVNAPDPVPEFYGGGLDF